MVLVAAGVLQSRAQAQTPITLGVSSTSVEAFPTVSLSLTVADGDGQRIRGLSSGNFWLLEDGSARPDLTVAETEVGSRQLFAILTGRALRIRDSQGRTRFDLVRQALLDWWERADVDEYESDDLTLLTSDGPLAVHASASTLRSALTTHQPTFAEEASGYDLLIFALDYMADPPPKNGMPGSLVLIAPPIEGLTDVLMGNVVTRAKETATAIYPVLVGPPEAIDTPGADRLRQLAAQTGGVFAVFNPGQGLEGLAEKLIGRRFIYTIHYISQANSSGIHTIGLQVEVPGAAVAAMEQTYQVEILPPHLSFIQPPNLIVREADDPSLALEQLPPTSQILQILITFPDNHPRPITLATLLVDGQPVSDLDTPPFDHFTLDLTRFVESGSHTLRVEAEDSLGLSSTSEPIRLEIEVRPPPRGLVALRPALGSIAAALAVLIIGVALAVSLMSAGHRQAASSRGARRAPGLTAAKRRASLQRRATGAAVEGMLIPVDGRGQEGKPLPLTGVDVVLGRDASLAGIVIDDPSVSGIHARMIRLAGGGYFLRDQGSVAGTWINFRPVSNDGAHLSHEDLIHVGRVGLRFRLASPPPPREIRVRPVEGEAATEGAGS